MPQVIKDEAGNEVEMFTAEEVNALKQEAEKLKENAPKQLREALKRKDEFIESLLKEKNAPKEDDKTEDDEIEVTKEDIERIASEKAESSAINALLQSQVNQELARFPDEDRPAIKKYYDKLTAGEQVNIENYRTFIEEATKIVFKDQAPEMKPFAGRSSIRGNENGVDFVETERGKALKSRLFG
jgi:flagellar biosynthesis GTPase FlhF